MQTAIVNLRTAKIQLLQLLNDRTPMDQFDVTGPFDFSGTLATARRLPADRARYAARPARGDADRSSSRRRITSWRSSNGSTDPTFSAWYTYNPSLTT